MKSVENNTFYVLPNVTISIGKARVKTVIKRENALPLIVYGEPQDTKSYKETAKRLNYGDDIVKLNRDHEITHSLLAYWLELPCSPTLKHVAEGGSSTETTGLEEDAVLAIQRFAMHLGIDLLEILNETV